MAHVERVSVEGFKTIAELSVEPGQFTVVTGRNNSGKTSLLEAVRLGCEPETVGTLRVFDSEGWIDTVERGIETVINRQQTESVVKTTVGDTTERVRLRPASNDTARAVAAREAARLIETKDEKDGKLLERIRSELESNAVWNTPGDALSDIVTRYVPENSNWIQQGVKILETGEERYRLVDDPQIGRKAAGTFLDRVRSEHGVDLAGELGLRLVDGPVDGTKLVEPSGLAHRSDLFHESAPASHVPTKFVTHGTTVDVDDDPVKTDDIGDFLREKEILEDLKTFTLDDLIFDPDDGEKYAVPFDQMGDGFRAIVALLWELLDDDLPEVVFLEEPTTHMHPGYVREVVYFLIQLAMEEDVQLFVTTHSNDFLNDLFAENLREEEVAFLEEEFKLFQMQDGGAKTLDYREAEHSLEELMLDLRGV